jgi:hypothetical protein
MSETKLVTPIVHLNGTSKAELLRLREEFYAAVEQHRRRCASLTDLMREMEEECRAIQG